MAFIKSKLVTVILCKVSIAGLWTIKLIKVAVTEMYKVYSEIFVKKM